MSNCRLPFSLAFVAAALMSDVLGIVAPATCTASSSIVDWIVKDVCVDIADRPILIDPFAAGCPRNARKRKLRIGTWLAPELRISLKSNSPESSPLIRAPQATRCHTTISISVAGSRATVTHCLTLPTIRCTYTRLTMRRSTSTTCTAEQMATTRLSRPTGGCRYSPPRTAAGTGRHSSAPTARSWAGCCFLPPTFSPAAMRRCPLLARTGSKTGATFLARALAPPARRAFRGSLRRSTRLAIGAGNRSRPWTP
jgi:hypothetical protein